MCISFPCSAIFANLFSVPIRSVRIVLDRHNIQVLVISFVHILAVSATALHLDIFSIDRVGTQSERPAKVRAAGEVGPLRYSIGAEIFCCLVVVIKSKTSGDISYLEVFQTIPSQIGQITTGSIKIIIRLFFNILLSISKSYASRSSGLLLPLCLLGDEEFIHDDANFCRWRP